jgi:hypothetical protein
MPSSAILVREKLFELFALGTKELSNSGLGRVLRK